jgi:hypothetical protein
LTLLDRAAFATIKKLIEAGVLHANEDSARTLYRACSEIASTDDGQARRLAEALAHLAQGKTKQRMANVLSNGGFPVEALGPMREAVETAIHALVLWRGHNTEAPPTLDLIDSTLVQPNLLPAATLSHIALLREEKSELDEAQAGDLLAESDRLFLRAVSILDSAQRR